MKREPVPESEQCPVCRDTDNRMLQMDGYQYCPAEDPHPGGVVVYPDGLTKMSGLAPRGMLAISPKNGGPTA